jgi:Carboxypeptidase regulatory-like domain
MRRRQVAHGMLLLTVTANICAALSMTSTVAVAQSIGIAGHVVDNAGTGLPGVVAMAIPQRGGDTQTVVTGTNGTYTFEDLPEGIYRVDFDLPGFDMTRRNLVAVRAGETTRVDVTLQVTAICECIGKSHRLDQSRLTVHMGQVVDPSGRPLPHAQLEIVGPGGPETVYASREGRFQIRLSSAHKWPMTARDSGFGDVTMKVSGRTRTPLLFRLPNADTRKLPVVERLRRPCCPSDLFANLGP